MSTMTHEQFTAIKREVMDGLLAKVREAGGESEDIVLIIQDMCAETIINLYEAPDDTDTIDEFADGVHEIIIEALSDIGGPH